MDKILSIEEAAEILGLDYKTIYRRVRNGEIPAAKFGRVYRIRESDLHKYFDHQVEEVKKDAMERKTFIEQEVHCAFCQRRIYSRLSISYQCEICSKPICIDCFTLKKIRFCTDHIKEKPSIIPHKEIKCGRCGKPIVGSLTFVKKCKEPNCEEMLCKICSALVDEPFCKTHSKLDRKSEEVLKNAYQKGLDVVPAVDAREMEKAIMRDIKNRISMPISLVDPVSQKEFLVQNTKIETSIQDSLDIILKLNSRKIDKKMAEKCYPLNVNFNTILSTRIKGLKRMKVHIDLRVISRLQKYVEHGFDIEPLNSAELGEAIDKELKNIEHQKEFHCILFSSPTGWDKTAIAMVTGEKEKKGFIHQYISVCLLDLKSSKVYYNANDEKVIPYLAIFAPEILEELITNISRLIEDRLLETNHLTVDEVTKKFDVSNWIVKEIFTNLSRKNNCNLDIINNKLTISVS